MPPYNINTLDPFQKPSHKKRNLLIILATFLVIFILLPLLVLGWMGLVPGLSNLMGTSKPRDLGVSYNRTDLDRYKQKTNIKLKPLTQAPVSVFNASQKSLLTNPITTNKLVLTQNELTAALNNLELHWLPMTNIQAKISNDNLEISGKLNSAKIDDFRSYLNKNGNINNDAKRSIDWARRFSNNAPIYIKAKASITDNILSFNLSQAQIGRVNIPLGDLGNSLSDSPLVNVGAINFDAKQAKLSAGQLEFVGTYPSIIYIK